MNKLGLIYDAWSRSEALDDDAEEREARARITIRDAMPEFIAQQARDRTVYDSQLRALNRSISKIDVPSPKLCDSMLILGVGASEAVAGETARGLDPFTKKKYDCVYGFGFGSEFLDLLARGIPDHIGQSIDMLSPITKYNLNRLSDQVRIVPQLVVHSNGLAIAESLIRSSRITGVKEIRVLGGDGSLMNLDGLRELADTYNLKIYVYAIKGDPVPLAPLGWKLREYGESLTAQIAGYATHEDVTYQLLGLQRHPASADSNLQVVLLNYPNRVDPIDYHRYEAYSHLLYGLNLMGCIPGGSNRRCNVSY